MRLNKVLIRTSVAIVLTIGLASQSQYFSTFAQSAQRVRTAGVAVGPQYDTTHVYVPLGDFDRFVASIIQTFGGKTSQDGVLTVTPTPSSTRIQLVLTPVGTLSVFGFKTPIPYPFGLERTGYLVTDMDEAIRAAKGTGADVLVVAGWREHPTVLAHYRSVLYSASDNPGKSGLCVIGPCGCLRAQLSYFLPRKRCLG